MSNDFERPGIDSGTITFSLKGAKETEMKRILLTVYNALIEKGYDGLIQVYPLSCMPEIVADGILSGMQRDYGIPVLRLIIDEHSGRAGNQTRIEAFADMLKRRRKIA